MDFDFVPSIVVHGLWAIVAAIEDGVIGSHGVIGSQTPCPQCLPWPNGTDSDGNPWQMVKIPVVEYVEVPPRECNRRDFPPCPPPTICPPEIQCPAAQVCPLRLPLTDDVWNRIWPWLLVLWLALVLLLWYCWPSSRSGVGNGNGGGASDGDDPKDIDELKRAIRGHVDERSQLLEYLRQCESHCRALQDANDEAIQLAKDRQKELDNHNDESQAKIAEDQAKIAADQAKIAADQARIARDQAAADARDARYERREEMMYQVERQALSTRDRALQALDAANRLLPEDRRVDLDLPRDSQLHECMEARSRLEAELEALRTQTAEDADAPQVNSQDQGSQTDPTTSPDATTAVNTGGSEECRRACEAARAALETGIADAEKRADDRIEEVTTDLKRDSQAQFVRHVHDMRAEIARVRMETDAKYDEGLQHGLDIRARDVEGLQERLNECFERHHSTDTETRSNADGAADDSGPPEDPCADIRKDFEDAKVEIQGYKGQIDEITQQLNSNAYSRAPIEAGSEQATQLQAAVQQWFVTNGVVLENDTQLSYYVTEMVINGRDLQVTMRHLAEHMMTGDVEGNLQVQIFLNWLFNHVLSISQQRMVQPDNTTSEPGDNAGNSSDDLENCEKERKALQDQLDEANAKIAELESDAEAFDGQMDEYAQALVDFHELQGRLTALQAEQANRIDQLDAANARITELENEAEVYDGQYARFAQAMVDNDEIQGRLTVQAHRIAEVANTRVDSETQTDTSEQTGDSSPMQAAAEEDPCADIKKELEDARSEIEDLKAQNEVISRQLRDAQAENTEAGDTVASDTSTGAAIMNNLAVNLQSRPLSNAFGATLWPPNEPRWDSTRAGEWEDQNETLETNLRNSLQGMPSFALPLAPNRPPTGPSHSPSREPRPPVNVPTGPSSLVGNQQQGHRPPPPGSRSVGSVLPGVPTGPLANRERQAQRPSLTNPLPPGSRSVDASLPGAPTGPSGRQGQQPNPSRPSSTTAQRPAPPPPITTGRGRTQPAAVHVPDAWTRAESPVQDNERGRPEVLQRLRDRSTGEGGGNGSGGDRSQKK